MRLTNQLAVIERHMSTVDGTHEWTEVIPLPMRTPLQPEHVMTPAREGVNGQIG